MFKKLKAFFEEPYWDNEEPLTQEKLNIASAALLLEVGIVDEEFVTEEYVKLKEILVDKYSIKPSEVEKIIDIARQRSGGMGSAKQITSFLNANCSYEDKLDLSRNMWTLALADGFLTRKEIDHITQICQRLEISDDDIVDAHENIPLKTRF